MIRELLRLKYELGRSHREIATSLGIANSTVSDYVRRASAAGVSWPLPEGLDDTALEAALFPPPPPSRGRKAGPHTVAFIKRLLASQPHPEQGYRSLTRAHASAARLLRRTSGGRLPPRSGDRHGELPVRQLHPRHRPHQTTAATQHQLSLPAQHAHIRARPIKL